MSNLHFPRILECPSSKKELYKCASWTVKKTSVERVMHCTCRAAPQSFRRCRGAQFLRNCDRIEDQKTPQRKKCKQVKSMIEDRKKDKKIENS